MFQQSAQFIKQWNEGSFSNAYKFLGLHLQEKGAHFAVWAPNAQNISVVGDFNSWDGGQNPMQKEESTGIWTAFVRNVEPGAFYKYEIKSPKNGKTFLKSDPYARLMEKRPQTASVVYDSNGFDWDDHEWMKYRKEQNWLQAPISIYEVHAGSWKRKENGEHLNYRELANELIPYIKSGGFTHVELLPIAEHPFDPSWGYQVTGFFAPTSRYGEPKDFMYFINECHKSGIGVIMDWVPGHFPKDENGLKMFDGTPLYEYADPQRREQKDWGTYVFDYGKAGVRNFLLSNACYWCEKFHIDGLRVDAVASMLYLDYSKDPDEWTPNKNGGNEHLEAIQFLKDFNSIIHQKFADVLTFAEESTSWPGVTVPISEGGLGFDFKWNMGWMNDTLSYITQNWEERDQNSDKITFAMAYNQSENFVLPLSHDEVVHLKKPLLKKNPGNEQEQFANLRLLLTYLYGHPGKKLLFMGDEFAETKEWSENRSLQWNLLENHSHREIKRLVDDLNKLYRREKALHIDKEDKGFEWIETGQEKSSFFVFLRKSENPADHLLFVLNFSASRIKDYYSEIFNRLQFNILFNSDSKYYGGGNGGGHCGKLAEQRIYIEPFSALILKPERQK